MGKFMFKDCISIFPVFKLGTTTIQFNVTYVSKLMKNVSSSKSHQETGKVNFGI